ncbi:MAG: hypothetical protein BGO14_03625 [Chlamydiales bacterium 38-26]|mgnify:CR=1 FL=1|nr:hypothetical protein [Chlamydiales bacterium]OJV09423.1 MAG: hypothetical protein BGO14_03625 [Chlamydiales bacterium 38-26]
MLRPRCFAFIISLLLVLLYFMPLQSVIIAKAIEVHLTVEDGEMQQAVITEVKFEGECVDISKKSFMNRKISKVLKVAPGQYSIEWMTEKTEKPWGGKKITKKHQRLIILELTDAVVYVNIRGENLTTY